MHKASRIAVSAVALSGGLLLAAPAAAQEATATPCPYPFNECPTAPPTTAPPTTAPPTTAPPISGGGENPATGEEPEPVETTPAVGGGGGGPAVVDNSPVRGSTGGAASLPFTGGEVTLIALTGTAALAGGLVLVAAGRRRSTV